MKIKPKKIFNTIIFVLFTLYISFYIASVSGYYEYEKKEETTLTNEKMKEFEKDLKEGKKVDIKKYLTDNTKKYAKKYGIKNRIIHSHSTMTSMNYIKKFINYFLQKNV